MSPPVPTRAELARLVSLALARGVPVADAEDVVARSYERAAAAYDPERGAFGALLQRVVQREIVEWWRGRVRSAAADRLAPAPGDDPDAAERAEANQRRLLAALTEEERHVFATWVLQKARPDVDAKVAAERLGMSVPAFDNAKRRLRTRIRHLADQWGLAPREFFSVADDEGPRPREVLRGRA